MKTLIIFVLLTLCFLQTPVAQISRTTIMSNGNTFTDVSYQWTASSANINNWLGVSCPIGCTPYSRLVYCAKPPTGCVIVGTNYGMPYKWGGSSTIAQHNSAMSNGKSAGDICYNYGNNCFQSPGCGVSNSYASGMDCSGFVCKAWNISYINTTSLANESNSIAIKAVHLREGDIYIKPGSHVRLFSNFAAIGGVQKARIIEAAKGSPAYARVHKDYYTVNATTKEMTDYTARVFVNTPSGCTRPTSLVSPTKTSTTVTINWTSSGATSYDYYYKKASEIKYTVIQNGTQKPKTITGLQPGTAYNFKVSSNCSNGTWGISTTTLNVTTSSAFTGNEIDVRSLDQTQNYDCKVTTSGLEISSSDVTTGSSYQLCDVIGRIVSRGISVDNNIKIFTSTPGIYILFVVDGTTGSLCVKKVFVH